VVDFVAIGWVHDIDVQTKRESMAFESNSSHNVAAMTGLNEPPVIADSPFVNIIINKREMATANRQ